MAMHSNPHASAKIVVASAPAVRNTGAHLGANIDTAATGAKSATFMCVANNGTNGTTAFKIQTSHTTTDGDYVDITGATVTVVEADDDEMFVIHITDLHRHRRYLRVHITVGTANTVGVASMALLNDVSIEPTTQHNTVVVA